VGIVPDVPPTMAHHPNALHGEWTYADQIVLRASANHVRKQLAWRMIRSNMFVR
jgi:hypothetical protein